MGTDISNIRKNYKLSSISKKNVDPNPLLQLEKWMNEAINKKVLEPTAMIIATVGKDLKPSTRTVLLKGISDTQLVFYTNYLSRKGRQLEENAQISGTLLWKELERQVHIEGKVEKASSKVSDEYFQSRPRASKIGARISPQSQVIKSRTKIKVWFAREALKVGFGEVQRPENWGGYYIFPERMEFWQGRPNRLHDRILYSRQDDQSWTIDRLAP